MTTAQFHIPNLLALFHGRDWPIINPVFTQLDEAFMAWTNNSPFSPSHKMAWKHAEMPLLTSLAFPNGDAAQLSVCLDYMVLSLILEQLTDRASSADSQKWADTFIDFLQGTEKPSELCKGDSNPSKRLMKQLSSRIMESIGQPYRDHFVAGNIDLARGMTQESLDREELASELDTTVESFINTRRNTIGLKPFLALARWARGIDLSDEVLNTPALRDMVEATIDMVFLANDIYSYKKERAANDAQHNFITVAMQDPSTGVIEGDLQGSIYYAADQFKAALRRFQERRRELYAQVRSYGQDDTTKIEQYIASMVDLVVGNIEWSIVNKRYDVFENEESRALGTVKLTIPRSPAGHCKDPKIEYDGMKKVASCLLMGKSEAGGQDQRENNETVAI